VLVDQLNVSCELSLKVASYNDRLAVWELLVEPVEVDGKHRLWEIFLKVILRFVNSAIVVFSSTVYKGRSINKLQNSVNLLVFQILRIRNIRFVGNIILSSSCEFYNDDITVTSFINIKYGNVATEVFP